MQILGWTGTLPVVYASVGRFNFIKIWRNKYLSGQKRVESDQTRQPEHFRIQYWPILGWGCSVMMLLVICNKAWSLCFFQINGKDMKIARHEDAVAMLTGGLSYVTLVVCREKVVNKRMLPLSKLQDQSFLNKKLGVKVGTSVSYRSKLYDYSVSLRLGAGRLPYKEGRDTVNCCL